jgi:hypothetical protein
MGRYQQFAQWKMALVAKQLGKNYPQQKL